MGHRLYDAASVKRLIEFLTRCRQQLKNKANLFWVSLQSNLLADLSSVQNDFKTAVQEMNEELKMNGWILPSLQANMRNQVNIANIQIDRRENSGWDGEMQSSIDKLPSGSSLVGEIPVLFRLKLSDWNEKKDEVLKHCVDLMSQKSDKNIVVLYDSDYVFKDVADDIQRVIKDKKVVAYPLKQSRKSGILNIKQFVEESDHILVTENKYFNGCESANVIFLFWGDEGIRNSLLRGVQNMICIQLTASYGEAIMIGMKEDNRFS